MSVMFDAFIVMRLWMMEIAWSRSSASVRNMASFDMKGSGIDSRIGSLSGTIRVVRSAVGGGGMAALVSRIGAEI